jgi:hypothetical protein
MKRVLMQFDTDVHPSSFDAVVAIDSGVDVLIPYGQVQPEAVRNLVYGALFTRSPDQLQHTAIFVGGSRVEAGERLLEEIKKTFFGPFSVSVMLDSGGANTTAAAAVLRVAQYLSPAGRIVVVLGGTGPVGQRVARLLARQRAYVRLASRSLQRARDAWARITEAVPGAQGEPAGTGSIEDLAQTLLDAEVVISAGAAGVQLLPAAVWHPIESLGILVDLNVVPPLGIEGVEPNDKAVERDGVLCFGGLAVGSLKMKIHRAAIARLFERNDLVLDAEEIYEIGLAAALS